MTTSGSPSGTTSTNPYASYTLDHLGLVSGMVDELGLVERIDSLIVQDQEQRHVSVGLAVKAMILNGLGFVNRALYLMPQFFKDKPVKRLLGPGITAEQLNDDTLGRALDELYDYGVERLYPQLAALSVNRLGLACQVGHLDATSFHVDGSYNSENEPPEDSIHLTRGYSRDHRPDLNQVVLQLLSENQAGIPLLMAPMNGNSNDQTGFRHTINAHLEQMKGTLGLQVLVADSALYNEKTLQALGEFSWISRVPETLGAARTLTLAVAEELESCQEDLAYRALGTTYAGIRQRWLVVYTRSAHERAEKTLKKQHLKQGNTDLKGFERLCQTAFACEADAQAALQALTQKLTLTTVCESRIVARPRYAKPGRPRKQHAAASVHYGIEGQLASIVEVHRQKLQRKSCFIVATNELDEQILSHEQVIDTYKKDQQKVERGFRFLKDPRFMASTLFLKSPKRLMALMMVMTLCLLVYGALEYRIRRSLQHHRQTFPHQQGHATDRPTARWVFQFFSGIHVLLIESFQDLVLNLNPHHRALLALLGECYVDVYANSS